MNIKKTMKKFIFILALALSQFSSAQSGEALLIFHTNEIDIAMFDSNDQQIGHTIDEDEDEIYFEVSLSENYTFQIEELPDSTFSYSLLSLIGFWSILDQGIISSSTTNIYSANFTVEFVDVVDVLVKEPTIIPWQNGFPGEEGVPFDAESYNAIKSFGSFLGALDKNILIIKKDDVSDFSLISYSDDNPFVNQSYDIQDIEDYFVWYILPDQDYELNVNYLSELSTGWGVINISGDSHEIIGDGLIENTTTTLTSNISVFLNDNGEEEEDSWDDNFPGTSGVSFDMDSFAAEIHLIYEFINSDSTNMVLVVENTEQNISVTSASGAVLEPTTFDEHFLVFGVIEDNQQYTILVDENENLDIGWGLFLPVTEEIVVDGVITSEGDVLNGMFTVSTSLSLEEQTTPLEVYNTTYLNLLGEEVKTFDKGLYIKVMQTNKGQVAEKVYLRD
jgi:hypothetical protein